MDTNVSPRGKIKVTHIDNCSHGYYSISKKDVIKLGIKDKISGYSGMTLNRCYLEEDCDGNLLDQTCKDLGYELIVKSGYNPSFKIHHNYNRSLFDWKPKIGQFIRLSDGIAYEIIDIEPKSITIRYDFRKYRIDLKRNPFNYIQSLL